MARRITAWMRHGHYEQPENVPSAHLPHPLTRRGVDQAREGAALLWDIAQQNGWRIHPVIDCSRMLRAWQTATLVAEVLSSLAESAFSVEEFEALAERGLGAAANLDLATIERVVQRDPRFEDLPNDWKYESFRRLPFQGAESLVEAGERVARHIADRCSELDGDKVDVLKVFIGHGGAFRHAAASVGLLNLSEVRALSMYHCRPVFMERVAEGFRHVCGEWKQRKKDQPTD